MGGRGGGGQVLVLIVMIAMVACPTSSWSCRLLSAIRFLCARLQTEALCFYYKLNLLKVLCEQRSQIRSSRFVNDASDWKITSRKNTITSQTQIIYDRSVHKTIMGVTLHSRRRASLVNFSLDSVPGKQIFKGTPL